MLGEPSPASTRERRGDLPAALELLQLAGQGNRLGILLGIDQQADQVRDLWAAATDSLRTTARQAASASVRRLAASKAFA